jgi:AcrR family transcriptional regulator
MVSNRDDVLGAAQRLLNLDAAASMGAIAEAAGVSRATVHRHFASREALLVELGTRSLDRWESRMDDGALEEVAASGDASRIRALLEQLVLGYVEDSDDFGFALTDHVILADPALEERTERLAVREALLYAAAQAAGVLRADMPPRWFGYVVCSLLVAGRDALRTGHVTRREVPTTVLSSLLTGVSTPS